MDVGILKDNLFIVSILLKYVYLIVYSHVMKLVMLMSELLPAFTPVFI